MPYAFDMSLIILFPILSSDGERSNERGCRYDEEGVLWQRVDDEGSMTIKRGEHVKHVDLQADRSISVGGRRFVLYLLYASEVHRFRKLMHLCSYLIFNS